MGMMEKAFFLTLQKVMKSRDELVGRPGVGFCGPLSLSLYREDGERERERERESRFTFLHVFLGVPSLVFSWRGGGVNGNERVKWTYLSVNQSVSQSVN